MCIIKFSSPRQRRRDIRFVDFSTFFFLPISERGVDAVSTSVDKTLKISSGVSGTA